MMSVALIIFIHFIAAVSKLGPSWFWLPFYMQKINYTLSMFLSRPHYWLPPPKKRCSTVQVFILPLDVGLYILNHSKTSPSHLPHDCINEHINLNVIHQSHFVHLVKIHSSVRSFWDMLSDKNDALYSCAPINEWWQYCQTYC